MEKIGIMALCRDVVENIMGYIDMELDDKTLEELERHLEECPECQAFVRTYRKMLEISGRLKGRSFVSPDVRRRLREFLKSQIKM